MEFHLLQILTFLLVALCASHAMVDPEVYFKSMLPNTPIPKAIKDSLQNEYISRNTNHKGSPSHVMGIKWSWGKPASPEELTVTKMSSLFYLEKEMRQGKKINLHITKDKSARPTFIPRQVVVNPDSVEAKLMKKTINECEKASNQGEEKYCATSLESMVDFVTSKFGKNVEAISTKVNGSEGTTLREYTVEGVKIFPTSDVIICQKEDYAYGLLYNCHRSSNINAYMVSLVGEKHLRAKAISVCHEDTASWYLKHLAFEVLNVKPGTNSICRFLVEGEVAWVPS